MNQMITAVILFAAIYLAFIFGKRWFPAYQNRLKPIGIPDNLGIKPNLGLEGLAERLEKAWDNEYAANVKERVLAEGKMTASEYDMYELELKRFFLMSALLKNVPMYNEQVDEIWHEMLMFTKNYETFSFKFTGCYIHHEPNVTKNLLSETVHAKNSSERAWFELIYTNLFEWSPNTFIIFGPFRFELDQEVLWDFEASTIPELSEKYFNPKNVEAEAAAGALIKKLIDDIDTIRHNENLKSGKISLKKNSTSDSILIPTVLFTSYYGIDDQEIKKEASRNNCSGWSTCTGSGPDHKHDHNHHDHSCSSGNSCSSSSCSSSSCGSSCGGS
ncbi:hypothetical protein [Peribacillus deserti]|nr:hypothetical protein [Peribacillus deserti]